MTFRILLFACILVFLLFLVIIGVSIFSPEEPKTPTNEPANQTQNGGLIPTSPAGNRATGLPYSKDGTDKLIETVKERPTPANQADTQIRESLTTLVGDNGGVLYQSPQIKISYVPAPNDFETEILTGTVQAGKDEAVAWLKDQGLTEDGICKLPLFFYLSPQARAELQKTDQSFNPIPDFCL